MGVTKASEVRIGIVAVAATLALILAGMQGVSGFVEIFDSSEPITRDAVYMGGATIIALAVFGSVLSTGLIISKDRKLDEHDILLVYGGTIGITVTQGLSMVTACCLNLNAPSLTIFMYITIICAIPIIIGFVRVVERQQYGSKGQDNGQSDAQDGAQGGADKTDTKNEQDEGRTGAPFGAST